MRGSSERGGRKVRNIARELAESESFEPPAGLLEKIKAEIPPEIRVGTAIPGPVRRSFVPRQRWLIAASLVAAVGAGMLGLRTWQSRRGFESESPKVEAHLAAPQSAAAKAAPRPSPAVPPPPQAPPSRAGELLDGVPEAAVAPPPPPTAPAAPKPEALQRRDVESLGYVSDERRKVQTAQAVPQPAEPENLPAPAPAYRGGRARVEKDDGAPVAAGAVGGVAREAPAGVENQVQRQEAAASMLRLGKQLQLKEEKGKKAYDAVPSKPVVTNPFLDATTHPLSTFGLGVETGSYALARRDLMAGHLPDPASVRVEEWLSYFDYGDPAPAQGDFAIHAEGSPSPFAQGPDYRLLRFNVTGTLQTVAQNAKAQVEFNSVVVASYRLLGYENRAIANDRFRDDTVAAGQIGAGHGITALYEIELRKNAPRWEQTVATLHLRYKVPGVGNTTETLRRVGFQDFAPAWEQASPAFRLSTLVAELAEILKGSPWAKPAALSDVARRIREVARQFPGNEKVTELVDLAARAARIRASQGGAEE